MLFLIFLFNIFLIFLQPLSSILPLFFRFSVPSPQKIPNTRKTPLFYLHFHIRKKDKVSGSKVSGFWQLGVYTHTLSILVLSNFMAPRNKKIFLHKGAFSESNSPVFITLVTFSSEIDVHGFHVMSVSSFFFFSFEMYCIT